MHPTDTRASRAYKDVELPMEDHDIENSSRSSTEVEFVTEEKSWKTQAIRERSQTPGLWNILRSSRWMLDTTLLFIIVALLARNEIRKPPTEAVQLLGDLTGVSPPRFTQKLTRFTPDMSYAPVNTSEFFTNETLNKWNDLMPTGMGFQWINDTHKYHDLPVPVPWYDNMTVFTTSVTHQIHCLFAMAQIYSGLASGHAMAEDYHSHFTHCVAYMRQAVLCAADTAIEGRATTFPDINNEGSDGWDATHVCKDYGEVKEYLESVRAYDDRLIY